MSNVPDFKSPVSRTSGKAIVSLVLGVLSFCVPVVLSIPGIIFGILSLSDIRKRPDQVRGQGLAISGIVTSGMTLVVAPIYYLFVIGFLIGLMLPAVQKVRDAANRAKSSNNLKQIGIGFHNYHSEQGQLPAPSINNPKGEALLSWRVAVLPYVEEEFLFKRFQLDQPWDGAANRGLLDPMPKTYRDPAREPLSNETPYRIFTGPGTCYELRGQSTRFADIVDGLSNTIMAVEASEAVPWSSPRELEISPNRPLPPLGQSYRKVFLVVMMDGSVRNISKTVSETTLRNAINPRDGNALGPDW